MSQETVLIVDDEEKNIKLIKLMLKAEEYHLVGAQSGEEALHAVEETPPDLILLDVMMPGIDGFEVCRRLKREEQTRIIPIVMVTALREKEHRVAALKAGADDFLSKPVDQTELVVRVKSLLRIKAYHEGLLKSYREISEKNEKLEELERAKEGLSHMIIHDLRNPLTAISVSLEMILLQKQSLNEVQHENLRKCVNYCSDLNRLIQSLLDIRRMEEGKMQLHKEPADLAALTEEALGQFKPRADLKGVAMSFSSSDGSASLNMDREIIKRVVDNLLNNAIRHTPEGGEIRVCVDIPSGQGGGRVRVIDNGDGLSPDYYERIFDKFEQADLKGKGVSVGRSGLGLAFCKMAVEDHGGKIWVESEGIGKGCTFGFVIPD
jgi:signal transduction histidine kinase